MYWDDKYGTHSVSPDVCLQTITQTMPESHDNFISKTYTYAELLRIFVFFQVISNMRVLMTEDSNNAVSNSFLLDDDSR